MYADAVAGLEDAPALRDLGLVHPRDHHRPVGLLSVGQRRRLGLAVAVAQGPDLMLLDEPTNHLSPALAGEIEEALGRSPGRRRRRLARPLAAAALGGVRARAGVRLDVPGRD